MGMADRPLLVFATKGSGSNDETRILELVADHDHVVYPFDRADKRGNISRLLRTVRQERPALIVMEGTGIAGGLAVLLARALLRTPYVVSSGDAVGPFLAGAHPHIALPAWLYEWLLCRCSAGFIGWTPYLVGRALTFGAPRAVTAAGWQDAPAMSGSERLAARQRVRASLGIGDDEIVFGIAGSLDWNPRVGYCYGYELVRATVRAQRRGLRALIVGDGSGRAHLERAAGDALGKTVLMTGRVPRQRVDEYLVAMD